MLVARTKEFDPDAALQAALELFWRRNYEATSMADLVEHLGVGRASIYATFGNKHELYLQALDRDQQARDPRLLRELSQPGPALPAVRTVVRRFATEAATDEQRLSGCFVTNTAAELARTTRPRPAGSHTAGTTSRPCCTRHSSAHRRSGNCRRTAIHGHWPACCWS
jgi:AcrR family transcriptional regulator